MSQTALMRVTDAFWFPSRRLCAAFESRIIDIASVEVGIQLPNLAYNTTINFLADLISRRIAASSSSLSKKAPGYAALKP